MLQYFQVNGYSLRGRNWYLLLSLPPNWLYTDIVKNLLPRSKFFPLRVDYILEGYLYQQEEGKAQFRTGKVYGYTSKLFLPFFQREVIL